MSRIVAHIEEVIVVLVFVIMSTIAFGNVLTRNLFSLSLSFTEEITINLFVILTFIGTSIGVRENAHLGFTLLLEKLAGIPKQILIIIVGLVTLSVFIIITYYGFSMVQFQKEMESTTPALNWPQWLFSLGIPVGAFLCSIRTIEATIKQLRES